MSSGAFWCAVMGVGRLMSYSLLAKIFHWGMVGLFAYGIFTQVDGDVIQLEDTTLLYEEIIFASLFLAILMMRFIYMSKTQSTALPINTSKWHKQIARAVHISLYISLASIAMSGLVIAAIFYAGFKTGILINLAVQLHELTVLISYWLIAAHIMAAFYHRLLGDGVWSAMTPFWKETNKNKP